MLTYTTLAQAIGIPKGTLSRKLIEYNKQVEYNQQIKPEKKEDHGHYFKHFFHEDQVQEIKDALKTLAKRRGRPANKPHHPAKQEKP